MKKMLYLAVAVVLMAACGAKTPEEQQESQADAMIKENLKTVLFDMDSYEPISTKVDTLYAAYDDAELCEEMERLQELTSELAELDKAVTKAKSNVSYWINPISDIGRHELAVARHELNEATERYDKANAKIDAKREEIQALLDAKPQFVGYRVTHSYKATDINGAPVMGNMVFFFDPAMERITSSMTVEDYENAQKTIRRLTDALDFE
ncbi:MAG: hypothetical protein IJQ59_04475 [Bacteroidaceae bacterium]|nr:hypothetical protein [Bacteroidaceae bacterium]